MATKQIITSDLTPDTPADTTATFTIGKTSYEIDLTNDEYKTFLRVLKPYVDNGRPVAKKRARAASAGTGEQAAARAWAKNQGLQVPARGQLPAAMLTQFQEATSS